MANLNYVNGRWVNLEKPGGQVIFVGGGTAAYPGGNGASDTYPGKRPTEPKSTIQDALDDTVAGRGDTVVLLPGSITITSALTMTKADVTLAGYAEVPKGVPNPSIITTATNSVEMLNVDADNVVVENLTFSNTAGTSDTFMIDVADTTASSGVVLRKLYMDCTGGAAALNAIRFGDGTVVCKQSVVEECTIYDLDDIGITISAASDENIVRGCLIFDTVTANAAVYAISCAGDGCTISENEIRTNGTAGIHLAGTLNQLNNNRVSAVGANSIGILLADGATAFGNGNVVTAIAAGNLVDATSDADSPTVFADTGNIYNADPATATFITATVGGS